MSLIKDKQKYFIQPLFKNMQGGYYKWIPVMTKRGLFQIEIKDNIYYVYFYGGLRNILTVIYSKSQKLSTRHLICDNHLHSKPNVMTFKNACYHIKDRIKFVEYYYNCVWMSLSFVPDIKRLIFNYL